jgi:peptide/nickel transport system permease protein
MRAYAIRRFLLIIPTMFLVTIILFILFRMIPGDVVEMMVQEQTWEQEEGTELELNVEAIRHMLGLDVPFHIQYGRWIWGIISRGDFGKSLWTGIPLLEMLRLKLPVTIELSLLSLILGLLFSVPIGIYAAIRQDTIADYIMRSWSIMALAIPSFWIATLVMIYPSIWWDWSPSIVYIPLVEDPLGNLGQFLLPSVIMGLFTSGGTMRITRTMMLEVLRQDYIRTAWAKGLRERVIIVRHALKNTLIPVITIVGGMIPGLFGGSVIFEQIFCLPGMGRYLLEAVNSRDYVIVSGHNLIFATFVMLVIVITDLAYAYVDPRIRYR